MSVQILEDIEEAIAREVRRISFSEDSIRTTTIFKETFNPFTGELVRRPIEPKFYDDTDLPREIVYPQFTISLLKLYEDLETKRTLPPYGTEFTEVLPAPAAYEIIIGGDNLSTTDGGGDSDVSVTHLRIRNVTTSHIVRILTGDNQGTYEIDSISLNGNGPHTITLSNDLVTNLGDFNYNPDAGVITFREWVDLTVVKIGDSLDDVVAASFPITAVNIADATLSVAAGSAVANGAGAKISRTGDVLQNDDAGQSQCYLILDPDQPVAGKGTRYRNSSWPTPYTFLYYIKIVSIERDDHISVANRMMQVFNPPRGSLPTIIRCPTSAESEFKKNVTAGDTVLYVDDASKFYVNETIRLCSNLNFGENLVIKSVNPLSNSIEVIDPVANSYPLTEEPLLVSNFLIHAHERDFRNHITEDDPGAQYWIHRFTYRIEAWIESRIPPYETEQTFNDVTDVNFIQTALEDFDGNPL